MSSDRVRGRSLGRPMPPLRRMPIHREDVETRRQFAFRNFCRQFVPAYAGWWETSEKIYEVWLATGGRSLGPNEWGPEMLSPLMDYIRGQAAEMDHVFGRLPELGAVQRRCEDGKRRRGLVGVFYLPKHFVSFEEQNPQYREGRRAGQPTVDVSWEEMAGWKPETGAPAGVPVGLVPREDGSLLPPLWTDEVE